MKADHADEVHYFPYASGSSWSFISTPFITASCRPRASAHFGNSLLPKTSRCDTDEVESGLVCFVKHYHRAILHIHLFVLTSCECDGRISYSHFLNALSRYPLFSSCGMNDTKDESRLSSLRNCVFLVYQGLGAIDPGILHLSYKVNQVNFFFVRMILERPIVSYCGRLCRCALCSALHQWYDQGDKGLLILPEHLVT